MGRQCFQDFSLSGVKGMPEIRSNVETSVFSILDGGSVGVSRIKALLEDSDSLHTLLLDEVTTETYARTTRDNVIASYTRKRIVYSKTFSNGLTRYIEVFNTLREVEGGQNTGFTHIDVDVNMAITGKKRYHYDMQFIIIRVGSSYTSNELSGLSYSGAYVYDWVKQQVDYAELSDYNITTAPTAIGMGYSFLRRVNAGSDPLLPEFFMIDTPHQTGICFEVIEGQNDADFRLYSHAWNISVLEGSNNLNSDSFVIAPFLKAEKSTFDTDMASIFSGETRSPTTTLLSDFDLQHFITRNTSNVLFKLESPFDEFLAKGSQNRTANLQYAYPEVSKASNSVGFSSPVVVSLEDGSKNGMGIKGLHQLVDRVVIDTSNARAFRLHIAELNDDNTLGVIQVKPGINAQNAFPEAYPGSGNVDAGELKALNWTQRDLVPRTFFLGEGDL